MESDPTRMCELLVGLPQVNVLGVVDVVDGVLRVHVETRVSRTGCAGCGVIARVKDRPVIELVDLPSFGRPTRLFWHKRRWCCLEKSCPAKTWTEVDVRIGAARMALSDRAGRWVTEQVGRHARSVNEVAVELACDSQTVNAPLFGGVPVRAAGLTRPAIDAFRLSCARSVVRFLSGQGRSGVTS